jgi:diadenosine tetraphosphate (Ap4A) HIT family hydrolase
LYYLDAARSGDQRAYMASLEDDRICIFCEEHVAEYQKHPVQTRGEFWYITRNSYPYAGAVEHYLIVPRRHVTAFDDLPDAAGAELWALQRELKERHAPLATATVMRSGDMRYNGGSVAHLHVHFVILGDAPSETVRFKVSA